MGIPAIWATITGICSSYPPRLPVLAKLRFDDDLDLVVDLQGTEER
jgi:hypothetical protein